MGPLGSGRFGIVGSFESLETPAPLPDVDEYLLDLTGKVGQRIDIAMSSGVSDSDTGIVFSQDFESGLGASETVHGRFAVNSSNSLLNNGTQMMGHPGYYGNNEYSYYEVQVDLTNFTNAQLEFDYSARIENHYDGFNLQASTTTISPPNDRVFTIAMGARPSPSSTDIVLSFVMSVPLSISVFVSLVLFLSFSLSV